MCDAYSGCKFLLAHMYCFSGVFDLILKFHKVQPLCKDVATIIALLAKKINTDSGLKSKIYHQNKLYLFICPQNRTLSSDEQFIDINIDKLTEEEPDKFILRAHADGKPEYLQQNVGGVTYKAVKVGDKIYIPNN